MLNLNDQKLTLTKTYLIAYSGGMDSHVLLHLCQLQQLNIKAVHINHGLNQQADSWQAHCEKICDNLNIPFQAIKIDASANKEQSPEQAAREARYNAFAQIVTKDDCLLTAHHLADQAETFLLQAIRGAGPKGLAAMPTVSNFGAGLLCRPLLAQTQANLSQYATTNNLNWITDPSNQDSRFDRNFLRNELLPQLQARWPSIDKTLARSAAHCAQTQDLLDQLAEQDLTNTQGSKPNTLSIKNLLNLNEARQRNVLRCWIKQLQLPLPNELRLLEIQRSVLPAKPDAAPLVSWPGVEVRRYRDDLYIMPPLAEFKNDQSHLRFRSAGDNSKNLFQEKGIPPWMRDRAPLVFEGDKLIDIIDES